MSGPQRFFRKLLLFVPVVLLIVIVNAIGDPAHLFFNHQYEKKLARLLLSGKNALNVEDFDERGLQKAYVQGLKVPKDLVILGSSRSMQLGQEQFPGETVFNSSVSGGALEDYIAIYHLYRERDLIPREIVLGIDPWVFNAHHGQQRWKNIFSDYKKGMSEISCDVTGRRRFGGAANRFLQGAELFSVVYFQASLKSIAQRMAGKPDMFSAVTVDLADLPIKRADGAYHYGRDIRLRPIAEVDRDVLKSVGGNNIYSLGEYSRLDPRYLLMFEKFVQRLRDDGVKVSLYLPPYHPRVYQVLSTDPKYTMVLASEQYLISFARRNNIKVFGSYDPSVYSLTHDGFFDGMHSQPEAVAKLFARPRAL